MTFFFNLGYLEKISCDHPTKFITLLENFYHKKMPRQRKGINYSRTSMIGNSFLLNPEPLFKNKTIDILYIVQYIKLAARRDFILYKQYGVKALQLSYFPDINMEVIKTNPLLKITNTEIFFAYEELDKEKTKWH